MKTSWKIKKLGDVCIVIAGQSPEGKFYNRLGEGMPFYQGKKDFGDKYINEPTTWTTDITKEAREGDVLMSVRAPVGPTNFCTRKICIGRGLAAIRAKKDIDRYFLFNFLRMKEPELIGNHGAVFNSINKTQIENIEILLPPLSEQKAIVKKLYKLFIEIDRLKEIHKINADNVRNLWNSVLHQTFNVTERESRSRAKNWQVKKLEDCLDKVVYANKIQRKYFLQSGSFPIISQEVKFINGYWNDIKDLFKLGKPVIVFGDHTQILKYIDFDFVLGADGIKILQSKDFLHPKFLFYFLKGINLKSLGYARHYRFLKEKQIYYPESINEQEAIVKKLDALSAETKKLQVIYKQKLADLEELKKSVLKKAFNGEL